MNLLGQRGLHGRRQWRDQPQPAVDDRLDQQVEGHRCRHGVAGDTGDSLALCDAQNDRMAGADGDAVDDDLPQTVHDARGEVLGSGRRAGVDYHQIVLGQR